MRTKKRRKGVEILLLLITYNFTFFLKHFLLPSSSSWFYFLLFLFLLSFTFPHTPTEQMSKRMKFNFHHILSFNIMFCVSFLFFLFLFLLFCCPHLKGKEIVQDKTKNGSRLSLFCLFQLGSFNVVEFFFLSFSLTLSSTIYYIYCKVFPLLCLRLYHSKKKDI